MCIRDRFRTLLIGFCIALGIAIGQYVDGNPKILSLVQKLFKDNRNQPHTLFYLHERTHIMKDQKSACLDTSTQDVSPTLNVEFTDHPLAQNSADKTSEDTVDTLGNQKVDTFATSQDVLDTQKSAEEGTSGTPRTNEAYTNNIHAVTPAETSEVTSDDGAELTDDVEDDTQDSLTFSNGVIEKIVAIAMRDVKDVVGMKGSWFNRVQDVLGASDARKGVTVEVTHDASVRVNICLLYTSPSPRDRQKSRMPSSA